MSAISVMHDLIAQMLKYLFQCRHAVPACRHISVQPGAEKK